MSRQNKQSIKHPMAARLLAALSLVGLFVFAVFLAAGGGGHFTPWRRRLIALLIEIPGVISLIYVIILERRHRRNLQRSNGITKTIRSN
jgi:hypothetical protein